MIRYGLSAGALVAALMLGSGPSAVAAETNTGPIFAVIEENDLFSTLWGQHQDRHYTQGLKLVYLSGDDQVPGPLRTFTAAIPKMGLVPQTYNVGFVFGQNMFTPEKLNVSTLITNDRPYAGWMYGGLVLQRRGETAGRVPVLDSFEFDLGVVGPDSVAEQSQRTIHRWGNYVLPRGWRHQLEDEPGLQLRGGRLWRLSPDASRRFFDFIPHAGVSLGNVATYGALGATIRLGWNLPEDFGVQNIDSTAVIHGSAREHPFGIYAFARGEGRAVGYNIFLDGNTWRHSHQVDRELLVADLIWGVNFAITRHVDFAYTRVVRTNEFEGQENNDIFGSLNLRITFCF